MNRIQRVSWFFRVLFQVVLVALPILFIFSWATSPESVVMMGGVINMSFVPRSYIATADHGTNILHTLSVTEKLMGGLVGAIPLVITLYIIYSLIKLFKLYEQGEIFATDNVRYIRNIGYAMLMTQVVNPIYEGLMGIVLTMGNPPGHRFASVTLDQTNFEIILTALMVILISWIMAEGCKLREEHQLTV